MPAIIRNYLDFEIIETDNPKLLIFIDGSEYMDEHPEKPLLEIKLPGFNDYFIVSMKHREVNILNANTIGITKTFVNNYQCLVDLPDGVWTLTYRICPYEVVFKTKHILRTEQLNIKIKQLYKLIEATDCSLKEDRRLKNKLIDINIFLQTGKAYAEDCDIKKASNFYQIADKFTNDLLKELTYKCR